MKYIDCQIPGVWLIEPDLLEDDRGFFTRLFCRDELAGWGADFSIAQVNLSGSRGRGTLRGMHFQKQPYAEDKLVRALTGAIFDVAVDLRPGSPAFGCWAGFELSAENRRSLLVPKGCAHGYLTLADDTETLYLNSFPYRPEAEGGLRWNDPFIKIDWPFEPLVISPKDRAWPDYRTPAGGSDVG